MSYSIDEFVAACATALDEANIVQNDARTASAPDARTIRYYQSLGLLSPPTRHGHAAQYSPQHVAEVVAIKRAQAAGNKLAVLAKIGVPSEDQFWAVPATSSGRTPANVECGTYTTSWTREITAGATLTVKGTPPTDPATRAALDAAIERVANLLERP